MYKVINILLFLIIVIFILFTYKYYSSSKNIKINNFNRSNINQILDKKIINLPILINDTNNIIVFNDSFNDEFKNEKKRNFWDLLKIR